MRYVLKIVFWILFDLRIYLGRDFLSEERVEKERFERRGCEMRKQEDSGAKGCGGQAERSCSQDCHGGCRDRLGVSQTGNQKPQ